MEVIGNSRLLERIPFEDSHSLAAITLAEFSARGDLVFRLWQEDPPRLGLWLAPTRHVRWQLVGTLHLNFGMVWLPEEVANLAGVKMQEANFDQLFPDWRAIMYQRKEAVERDWVRRLRRRSNRVVHRKPWPKPNG